MFDAGRHPDPVKTFWKLLKVIFCWGIVVVRDFENTIKKITKTVAKLVGSYDALKREKRRLFDDASASRQIRAAVERTDMGGWTL